MTEAPGSDLTMIGPTSWMRVVTAALLCPSLSLVFAGALTFETYSVNVITQPFGFLAAVWIAWRVARERVLWAVIPTAAFWLLVLALTFSSMRSEGLLRAWLTILGLMIASLTFAWWLSRTSRSGESEKHK